MGNVEKGDDDGVSLSSAGRVRSLVRLGQFAGEKQNPAGSYLDFDSVIIL